jgi:TorA maturation chaperone TorD
LERAIRDQAFVRLAEELPSDLETETIQRTDLDREALRIGYDNLFAVPGPQYVPPFASAHATDPSEAFESDSSYHSAGEAGELFGDPAHDVSEWYAQTDFRPDRGEGIPDHIAAEFEFMAALTTAEAQSLESAGDVSTDLATLRTLQRDVLEHMTWLGPFAEAVAEKDSHERLFAALSELAWAVVVWDAEQLDELSD